MINMLMKVVLLGLTALAATRMTTAATAVKKEAGSPQVGCHSDFSIRESQWVSWTNSKQEVELEGGLGSNDCKKESDSGECLLKLTSELARLSGKMSLALCNLGSPFVKSQLDVAKTVEYVLAWQQEVECVEYRLENFSQELVTRQPSVKKLAMLLSHALDSIAMAKLLSSELFELSMEISCIESKLESNFRLDHIIDNAKNSLTEAILATSIAEETHEILLVHANLTFMIRREVMLANHLQIISANTASTELVNTSGANQGIEELVPHLDYQAARLRKMVDLLQSVIGKISTFAAAEESLERVKNSVNHKGQQIASLIQQISTIQTSLSDASDLVSSISKIPRIALYQLESRVTKFQSYKDALLMFQRTMSQVLDHTLNLLIQFESIQRIADQYSIPEAESPFSTLDEIDTEVQDVQAVIQSITFPSSLQMEIDTLTGSNGVLLENINGTFAMIQDIRLQTGAQLSQRMGRLKTALDSLVDLKRNIISEEVKDELKDVHQQVEDLSSSTMLLAMETNIISGTIRNIEEFLSDGIIQVILSVTFEAEKVLGTILPQLPDIREHNLLVSEAVNNINISFNDAAAQFEATVASLEFGEEIVKSALNLLDQASLSVQFSNDSILTLNPASVGLASPTTLTTASREFHSLSLRMRKTDMDDCIIVHLTETWRPHSMDHYISVIVGVINETLTAKFVFSHPIGGMESVALAISESAILPRKPLLVEISRIDRNVHLLVQDIETENVHCTSTSISNMMASFFRTASSGRSTSINLGGASSHVQHVPFMGVGNFTGCLSEILLNGENLELWSLITSKQIDPPALDPCQSSEVTLRELRISCDGSERAQATILQGDLLPLEFSFSSFIPNGVLMYAFNNKDMASSFQVSLLYGHIVVKIASNGVQMTLRSLRTYTNGADQFFSLFLSNSSVVLQTSLEEKSMRFEFTETEAVLNHTNVFLCGIPDDLVNETGPLSNFTGCAALSSRAILDPLPLNCASSIPQRPCSYCLNEAAYAASFYGASFASFTPVTAKDRFDFGFSFITSFLSGLLLHSGNSSRGLWFDVVMVGGQLQLLFGSPFGILSLPARTPAPLNDLVRHSISFIVNKGANIDILVDGSSAGSFPFGSFFPSGTLTPGLSVGGIDPALEDIVMPGVTTEGFKGCIDNLRILGQLVDFSMSEKAEQVNFKLRNETQSIDAFRFDGEGYAQYDLGRFEANFNLGLQLRTLIPSVLLLYMESAFALQIVNGKVGLIMGAAGGDEAVTTISSNSSCNISDGLWHSVVVRKSGSRILLLTDQHPSAETDTADWPQIIQTNSDLFIGGVPSNRNVSLSGVIREGFQGEMRMAYLAHSVRSNGVQHATLETT